MLLALLGESYPTELSRLLDAPLVSVIKILNGLELDGVVATRRLGRVRRVSLRHSPHAPCARCSS